MIFIIQKVWEAVSSSKKPNAEAPAAALYKDIFQLERTAQKPCPSWCAGLDSEGHHLSCYRCNFTLSLTKVYIIWSQIATFIWIGFAHLVSWRKINPTVLFHPARKSVAREPSFLVLTLGALFWAFGETVLGLHVSASSIADEHH